MILVCNFMTKISSLGSWYPYFKRVLFPWPVNHLHVALVRGPLTPPPPPPVVYGPQADMHQLFMDHDWTGQGHQRMVYSCCCITLQLLLSLLLGLWPSESGMSEIVAGGRKFWQRSQMRAQNEDVRPHFVYQMSVPSQHETFVVLGCNMNLRQELKGIGTWT